MKTLNNTKQTVLITGGAGYIGSYVSSMLCSSSTYNILIVDNLSTGDHSSVETLCRNSNVFYAYSNLDLLPNIVSLLKEYNVSIVVHLAASVDVAESVRNPSKYYRNNFKVTSLLLKAMGMVGINYFVFSSTASIYKSIHTSPVTEESCVDPCTPYSSSKWMCEELIRDTAEYSSNFRYIIFRYFNVVGKRLDGTNYKKNSTVTHLIPSIIKGVETAPATPFSIFGDTYSTYDGTCVRDYVHVEDIASAHVKALTYLTEGGESETMNCGTGIGSSVLDVVNTVFALYPLKELRYVVKSPRLGDLPYAVANTLKIRRILKWEPLYTTLASVVSSLFTAKFR